MKISSTYLMPLKRRLEKKTNYVKRLAQVKSGMNRLVVRKSNNNITAQVVKFDEKGDITIVSSSSKELGKFGWTFHTGNLPAAYLTGYMCGVRAKQKKIEEAIFDIGLQTPVHGSRLFALLKGAVDAGMKIPAEAEVFPAEDRIKGKHVKVEMAEKFENVKKEIEKSLVK